MVQEIAGAPCQTPAGLLFCLKFVGADNDRVGLAPNRNPPLCWNWPGMGLVFLGLLNWPGFARLVDGTLRQVV